VPTSLMGHVAANVGQWASSDLFDTDLGPASVGLDLHIFL